MAKRLDRLREVGHDAIDFREEVREEARGIVDKVRADTLKVGAESADFEDMMTELLLLIENELATLTTKAVRGGFYLGAKRADIDRSED